MNDQWTERLSEYLDGELVESERTALAAHLAQCNACTATLNELRQVVARARALDDRPPETDLWPRIARKIGVETARAGRRLSFSVPQLLAASIALMISSAGAAWFAAARSGAPAGAAPPIAATSPGTATAAAWTSDARYDAAIVELETALQDGKKNGRLDTATVRVVERNLSIIDTAIVQARRALASDPGSAYLNQHLAETMQRKLALLRAATATART